MDLYEVIDRVASLLQQRGRLTYRALKVQFALSEEQVNALREELIDGHQVAADEGGKVLVWKGERALLSPARKDTSPSHSAAPSAIPAVTGQSVQDGERRQLTVQFIDLVGSTTLSQQLDPEDYHARVVAYQTACHQVIARYEGHIAQYLGDGVLVYFGYPGAHEDDAVRAVRSGLEIVTAVSQLQFTPPLQVRIGMHTGPVMVGEIGAVERPERLALGETPNIAARLQGQAHPDEVVISAATYRLVEGLFACEDRGQPELKGITTPLTLYRVVRESGAQSRFDVAVQAGLTPLVGRDEELALLRRRWEQASDGEGQVVLLSGEPGIGKSRLVQELKDYVAHDSAVRIEFRCSPYHQNSALYPVIEQLQQVLHFAPSDTPQTKLQKLEQTLVRYRFPPRDTAPLWAALLSLPHPETASPLNLTPQQQKQKTLDALLHWLFEEAERATVYIVWEDLHWADPSTLEFLALCLDQISTARMLMLLTFRPEFTPGWTTRSHVSHLVLSRLGRKQTSAIVERITGEKALPSEVLQQIVAKTDGVPLFIEELTKTVLESVGSMESLVPEGRLGRSVISLGIPATLQDSLMARLDRLGTAKEVAQQGAVVGREPTYEILSAISPLTEAMLQQELTKLVEAELLYQRGRPPQATYLFKHALVQETAYQSLLKSKRQQYHRQIAQVLETRFTQLKETQPELVAHHYTAAGLTTQAVPYWQRAGERAVQRSANTEAVQHLNTALELLFTRPETPERTKHELTLRLMLGPPLVITQGVVAPVVEQNYLRARALGAQLGDSPQLFPVLWGLWAFHVARGELRAALMLAEECLRLAERTHEAGLLLEAHYVAGNASYWLGEVVRARALLEQGVAYYQPQHHTLTALYGGQDPGVACLCFTALTLWHLGYPDQARARSHEALRLAQELGHPFTLAYALTFTVWLHLWLGEGQIAQERAEATVALSSEHGFPYFLARGIVQRGGALIVQGQWEEGIAQVRQGLEAYEGERGLTTHLAWLAEGYGGTGQVEEGLAVVAEALRLVDKNDERVCEAELYRLQGELRLMLATDNAAKAETCFQQAFAIARNQQAKSLELRAVMSLSRLWQQQGKKAEAYRMLSDIYGWFTEGFDTKDLQEAKAFLEELH